MQAVEMILSTLKVFRMFLPLQTLIPDSVLTGIVVVSILLAVMTIVLMWMRTRRSDGDGERRSPPFDPVLLGSALAVIVMAVIAYLTL